MELQPFEGCSFIWSVDDGGGELFNWIISSNRATCQTQTFCCSSTQSSQRFKSSCFYLILQCHSTMFFSQPSEYSHVLASNYAWWSNVYCVTTALLITLYRHCLWTRLVQVTRDRDGCWHVSSLLCNCQSNRYSCALGRHLGVGSILKKDERFLSHSLSFPILLYPATGGIALITSLAEMTVTHTDAQGITQRLRFYVIYCTFRTVDRHGDSG